MFGLKTKRKKCKICGIDVGITWHRCLFTKYLCPFCRRGYKTEHSYNHHIEDSVLEKIREKNEKIRLKRSKSSWYKLLEKIKYKIKYVDESLS